MTDKVSGAMAFINTSAMQTGLHGYDDWFGRDRESEPLERHYEDDFDGSLVIFAKPAMKILSSSPQYGIPLMPVQAANLLL